MRLFSIGGDKRERVTETWTETKLAKTPNVFLSSAGAGELRAIVAELDRLDVPDEAKISGFYHGHTVTWDREITRKTLHESTEVAS